MSEYGIVTEAGAVRFERLLPGPIEHVWAYLTQSDKRGTWLAAGPMDARVGGRVDLHFRHAELSAEKTPPEHYKELENGHLVQGSITRCEPPRLLSFTWGEWGEVTFELTPQDDDVLLVLTHRRLADRTATAKSPVAGMPTSASSPTAWPAANRAHSGRTHATVAAEYQKRIAAE